MLVIEDAGRAHPTITMFGAGSARSSPVSAPGHPVIGDASLTTARRVYAWADPDASGNGFSGPSNSTSDRTAKINNNQTPIGGPASCPWSVNNCGPNDEPFSFHSGVVNAAMCDGSVRAIKDTTSALTLKAIVGATDGINVNLD